MNYTAIGIMSGSSMDGIDIACVEFSECNGKWTFKISAAETKPLSEGWIENLSNAPLLSAKDYLVLHTEFGKYCGKRVIAFLKSNKIHNTIDCIGFHGHTTFHLPEKHTTHQLGSGAVLSTVVKIPVVSDLRAVDLALGGQGAPIIPIGEKLLFSDINYYLNIGGIANLSIHNQDKIIAFDVCPANKVLNMLAAEVGKKFDKDGMMASKGKVNQKLLKKLNSLKYYSCAYPKSLANDFGTDVVYPLIKKSGENIYNALSTYTEHIAQQLYFSITRDKEIKDNRLLATGGGALNRFLIGRIQDYLNRSEIEVIVPENTIVNFKEAIVMALIAVLRIRNESNVLASVTGASRNSCNGAIWNGK